MSKKKRQFRFRIPWITSVIGPKQRSKSHSISDTTNVSIQRPPFRPPGIAPVERTMMHAAWSSTRKEDLKIVSSADPVTNNVKSSSISPEEPPQQNDDISKSGNMHEKTVSVVTLTGDNRGATMHVGSSSKKEGSIHIHRAYKTNQTEETTDDDEENSRNDSTEKDEAEKVIVNSNIQSINNSMMLHGSISGRDPGVRVILPQYSVAVPVPPQEPVKHAETRKGEVNKLSYQPRPVIRRRCLRGLLLEASDSEPDNPHKPRRHGCKVRCGEIRKD